MNDLKVGRNDPCPCGSGKKYKKCCINKPEFNHQVKEQPSNHKLTLTRVKQLSVHQILEYLRTIGVAVDQQIFVEEINKVSSATELLNKWKEQFQLDNQTELLEGIYLSIRVLAERLALNHILLDDLKDLMQVGYDRGDPHPDEHGLFIWWKLWKDLQQWIAGKQVSSIEELDTLADSEEGFATWVMDFDHALVHAGNTNQQFISMRHIFAEDILKCFSESDEKMLGQFINAREETTLSKASS